MDRRDRYEAAGAAATRRRDVGRSSLRELLRSPGVQGVLVLAFGAQLAGVALGRPAEARPVALAPVVVRPAERLPAAPAAGAVARGASISAARAQLERRSQELAEAYRRQGFRVTDELARSIHRAAVEADIPPEIAFGLVRAESSFRNTATSQVGAVGLTQLMPKTADWLEPGTTRSELREPETNLRIGFRYLRQLLDKYDGDARLALTAYNRGPGTVDRALKRGRNPDNGYADFVYGRSGHGHKLFTR